MEAVSNNFCKFTKLTITPAAHSNCPGVRVWCMLHHIAREVHQLCNIHPQFELHFRRAREQHWRMSCTALKRSPVTSADWRKQMETKPKYLGDEGRHPPSTKVPTNKLSAACHSPLFFFLIWHLPFDRLTPHKTRFLDVWQPISETNDSLWPCQQLQREVGLLVLVSFQRTLPRSQRFP